jgi:hypothetical protein
MVQTRFATGRAMFIHWMFSNRALGEQWVQRAKRMAGGNGRQVASRKLRGQGVGMGRLDSRLKGYSRAAGGGHYYNTRN